MTHTLVLAALISSVYLLVASSARMPAIFATVASALEALITFGKMHLSVSGFPIGLLLGLVLLVAAALAYLRVSSKWAISAATIAVLVGLIQVLHGLNAF